MQHLGHFPRLETPRLQLRQIVAEDIGNIHRGLSDDRVTDYYAVAFPTLEATQEQMDWYNDLWEKRTGMWWAVCRKEEGAFLGAIGFNDYDAAHRKTELGYWLFPEHWGKGYASEALAALLDWAFENLHLNRIVAYVEGGNDASDRLLERMGFVKEGIMRECEIKEDRFVNLHVYACLKSDWEEVKAGAGSPGKNVNN